MSTDRAARVLVVEDDDEIAQVLQRSLRLEGYEVRIASDGEQALAMHAEYVPDVLVLDLGLPKVDGIDVARKVRAAADVPGSEEHPSDVQPRPHIVCRFLL